MQQELTHGGPTAAETDKMWTPGLWGKWDQDRTRPKEEETQVTFFHAAGSSWWTEAVLSGG